MTKNLCTNGFRRWFIGFGGGWILFGFLAILVISDLNAQSSESASPALHFKIPSPSPLQSAPSSDTTTTIPGGDIRSPSTTVPANEQKPVDISTEKPALQPDAGASSSTESLSSEPTPSMPVISQPPAEKGTDSSLPQEKPSSMEPAKAFPAVSPEKQRALEKREVKKTPLETSTIEKIISTISVNRDDPGGEVLNVMLNGFYPPHVSSTEGGLPRIICDFPEVRLGRHVPRVIPVNGKYIAQVRVGLHTKPALKVRIVLDLVPDNSYDVEQFYYQKENQYSLIVKKRSG